MSRAPRKIRLLAVLFGLALLAGACGDDGGGDAADGTTTTQNDPSGEQDDGTTTSIDATTSTTSDPGAEDPPGDTGGENEGLGDPLVFVATLSGDAEVPGPGDLAGVGRVEIESDVDGNLCFDMKAERLDAAVTASHIHEAAAGASGDVVIDIGLPTSTDGDTDTWSDVCVAVAGDVIERMNASPSNFYANIDTETFDDGAIRGQLEQATIFDLTLS